ncbi:uncharacterized protein LOC115631194 [Scaptodrosophila lebanonensis]|uniref:Uncharacterized protein LOC115631194 n=1 Tax=Drosophila lebanonensis TaxID=7225 RepID=A0A6J2U5X9_DROLE|nr:uncharacterized protein LOC115631194 [Scaptodrosophila lebanonensis]
MDEVRKYRMELRDHFYGKMWTSKDTARHFKGQVMNNQGHDHCPSEQSFDFKPCQSTHSSLNTPPIVRMTKEEPPAPTQRQQATQTCSNGGTHLCPHHIPFDVSRYNRHHQMTSLPTHQHQLLGPSTHEHSPMCGGAEGDNLLYSNKNFHQHNSNERAEQMGCGNDDPSRSHEKHQHNCLHKCPKTSYSFLESAREHLKNADARFNAKFPLPLNDSSLLYSDSDSTSGSKKTRKSTHTVISAKSGEDLRTMVRSQINMQQEIKKSITQLTDLTDRLVLKESSMDSDMTLSSLRLPTINDPNALRKDKREILLHTQRLCDERNTPELPRPKSAPKTTNTKTYDKATHSKNKARKDVLPLVQTEGLSLTVDDLVSSKVITPMVRKIQRMYLNNLREEMALMEDLERVPQLVSEVYKTAAVQNK